MRSADSVSPAGKSATLELSPIPPTPGRDTGDAKAGRGFDGVVEEGRFADSRLAAEHQHAAPPLVGPEQPVESGALPTAVDQSPPAQLPRPDHG
jgi:hypothetical protein